MDHDVAAEVSGNGVDLVLPAGGVVLAHRSEVLLEDGRRLLEAKLRVFLSVGPEEVHCDLPDLRIAVPVIAVQLLAEGSEQTVAVAPGDTQGEALLRESVCEFGAATSWRLIGVRCGSRSGALRAPGSLRLSCALRFQ